MNFFDQKSFSLYKQNTCYKRNQIPLSLLCRRPLEKSEVRCCITRDHYGTLFLVVNTHHSNEETAACNRRREMP